MASGTSSLESNGSNESISNSYVNNERHNPSQIQSIPHQIDYEVLTANQCYEKQNYSVKGHGHSMSGTYEPLQYDVISKQTNESLKQQCEKALHDLNQLRRQHTETSRRCEHVMKELEYFRGQHRAAMNQLDVSAQEASTLRSKYGDLLNDNQRLEREVQHLQQGGAPEGSSDALVHTLRKYESLKEEFDCFQKRYDDLIESHNTTLEKLRSAQEENSRLKTQCHDLTQERNAVERDQMVGELADARRHGNKKGAEGKEGREGKEGKALRVKGHDDKVRLSHNRDSAVDADVQDFEWEIIEVELSGLGADGELGFELAGGREQPCYPNDTSVYVTAVTKGSLADGKIRVLDRVAEACGASAWARGAACAAALRGALACGAALLRLQRARYLRRLVRLAGGVALHHGIFVSKIACGSAAAKEGNIYVGDRVVSINNRSLEGVKSVSEAMAMLNDCQYDSVLLTVLLLSYEHTYADKMVNFSSQTDEPCSQFLPPHDPKSNCTWDMIRGKIEAVTGRTKSKEKQNKVVWSHENITKVFTIGLKRVLARFRC
ncbi:PREDICTED: disks large homolog 5 [Papilio polytes]|uniref:disks large homolog 5 n=1 Tax=Papilio polytes TaxID=76194 RepID=UPI000675CE58|nr:PREDICTED: disks large homolog 5 [Papilio polytes]